jgi:hypothetical protein
VKTDVGREAKSLQHWERGLGSWLGLGLLRRGHIVVLRLPALMAEAGIGRQLRPTGAKLRHDLSLTHAVLH